MLFNYIMGDSAFRWICGLFLLVPTIENERKSNTQSCFDGNLKSCRSGLVKIVFFLLRFKIVQLKYMCSCF